MNTPIHRLVIATALGASAAALLVALLTIIGEEYAPLKDWLKATFMHHWLGKSYLSIACFVCVTAFVYPFGKRIDAATVVWTAVISSVATASALCIYFLLHILHFV